MRLAYFRIHPRGEVDALEVLGCREGRETLIGRAGLPGGQNAELLAGRSRRMTARVSK